MGRKGGISLSEESCLSLSAEELPGLTTLRQGLSVPQQCGQGSHQGTEQTPPAAPINISLQLCSHPVPDIPLLISAL